MNKVLTLTRSAASKLANGAIEIGNKARGLVATGVAVGTCALAHAQATAPVEISETAANLTAGFALIKTLVVSVVVFGLAIGYVKLLRKK